jgi:hypothetical protein
MAIQTPPTFPQNSRYAGKSGTSGRKFSCERSGQFHFKFHTDKDVFSIRLMISKMLNFHGPIAVLEGESNQSLFWGFL